MANDDTIQLLTECNTGIKMAVESLNEVIPKVENDNLRNILDKSLKEHKMLGDETHKRLIELHNDDKEINPIAKAMSWMKTNMKTMTGNVDEHIADLVTDGCNMGVKSISKYLNKYPLASKDIKDTSNKIIKLEEKLMYELREFL